MRKTILIGALAPLEGLADDAIRYGDCRTLKRSVKKKESGL